MTKNHSVEQRLLKALEEERFRRRLAEKGKRQIRNRRRSGRSSHLELLSLQKKRGWKSKDPWTGFSVPPDLDLESSRDTTCDFVKKVRDCVRSGIQLRLDFDESKAIKLSALVLLLAQIHKLRIEFGDDHLTGTYPKNPRIEKLLSDSGFYELLHVKSRKNIKATSKLTRFIRFKSDQKPNSAEIPKLRSELLGDDLQMPSSIAKFIFRALSEAMTNVNHHAYRTKSIRMTGLGGRWWMVANVSSRTRLFTLAFYDAGVGIPKTLPRKYPIEKIRGILSLLPGIDPDDGQMIKAAMELGRTRTDETNRGKGLLDLAKLIDTAGSGEMHIYSRHGSYSYASGREKHSNHQGFVEGTLIEWQLPIDKALENLPEEFSNELAAQD